MLTRHLYHVLTKLITKYTWLVASTVTLVFPLVFSGIVLSPLANLTHIPKDKITQHNLDNNSRSILRVNDPYQSYGESWAKGMVTTTTLASTDVFTTYLPLIFVLRPPLVNGDFELGRAYSDLIIGSTDINPASINPPLNWTRVSRIGYELFFTQSSTPLQLPIPAQNGTWATWLGGDDHEISYIQQQVAVPLGSPFLVFSYWIQSYDSFCGTELFSLPDRLTDFVASSPVGGLPIDSGGVVIDDSSGVLGVVISDLCLNSQTNGWNFVVINLNQYAGRSVALQIRSKGDSILTSSFFIDNVSLGGVTLTGSSSFNNELFLVPKQPSPLAGSSNHPPFVNSGNSVSKSILIMPNNVADVITKKGNAQTED